MAATKQESARRLELARALKHPVLRALEQSGGEHALGRGEAGVPLLPAQIREAGFVAIDRLATWLLSLFPNHGAGVSVDNDDLRHYVDLLGIESLMPVLRPRIVQHDVAEQVRGMAALLKRNPILVVVAAEYDALSPEEKRAGYPHLDEPAYQAEIRQHIAYSALLEAIGLECLLAPAPQTPPEREALFQHQLVQILDARLNAVDWKKHSDLFEILKTKLVIAPMKKRLSSKEGLDNDSFDDKTGDGLLLQLIVLDAMYGETLTGNDDNAECGFELFCQTSDKALEPLLGENINTEWVYQGTRMGVAEMHIAHNEAWVALYSSWNGAFCSNYRQLFFGKLYNAGVAGAYLDYTDTVYFFTRVCTLYTHVHVLMFERARADKRDFNEADWNNEILRSLWGRINLTAGHAYRDRIAKTLSVDRSKLRRHRRWRVAKRGMWLPLRAVIKGVKVVTPLSDRSS